MNRYENGKIYMITDIAMTKKYIGSTTESLKKRFERHKSKYPQYLRGDADNTRSYWLFDEFGVENCKILLIKNFPCSSKEELEREEGNVIRESESTKRLLVEQEKNTIKMKTNIFAFRRRFTENYTQKRDKKALRENEAYTIREAFVRMGQILHI